MLSATTLQFMGKSTALLGSENRNTPENVMLVKILFGMGTRIEGLDIAPSPDQSKVMVASVARRTERGVGN